MISSRWRERRLPGNPASAVYGTVVAAGQLAIESAARHSTGTIVASLAATLGVFWLAHAYTDTLGSAITADEASPPSLGHALRVEWPIVESGLLPVATLLLATALGAQPSTAALIALVVSAVELIGWAALAGRRAGATGAGLVVASVVAAGLGGLLVLFKYLIH